MKKSTLLLAILTIFSLATTLQAATPQTVRKLAPGIGVTAIRGRELPDPSCKPMRTCETLKVQIAAMVNGEGQYEGDGLIRKNDQLKKCDKSCAGVATDAEFKAFKAKQLSECLAVKGCLQKVMLPTYQKLCGEPSAFEAEISTFCK